MFKGTRFEKQSTKVPGLLSAYRKDYKLYGDLTIKGITCAVMLEGEFGGTVIDLNGQKKAGFSVRGAINRKDFDMKFGGVTEAGRVVLGDEVKIWGNIQLIKQV